MKWEADGIGAGYSSMSVVDDGLYTLGASDGQCYAMRLDAAKGTPVWKTPFSRAGKDGDYLVGWGAGPRSTPTVDGESVFVLSDVGVFACLDRVTGQIQWSTDLVADHGGEIPKWGYSESALVDGDRVIVTPGKAAFMIALNRSNGEKVWQSAGVDVRAHYISAMKTTFNGVDFYVTGANNGIVGFDCKTGEKLFEEEATGADIATIPTPILSGSQIYHTSGYGDGNMLLQLIAGSAGVDSEQIYHNTGKTMGNKHGGVVLVDGVIYGFSQAGGGTWMAQDLASGEVLWQEKIRGNKSGSIAYADGLLYCYNDGDGSVYLVPPSRDGWAPVGQVKLPRETSIPRDRGAIWAHPVIAGQMLYIRDQDLLFAYDIAG